MFWNQQLERVPIGFTLIFTDDGTLTHALWDFGAGLPDTSKVRFASTPRAAYTEFVVVVGAAQAVYLPLVVRE